MISHETDFQADMILARKGSECIYTEQRLICHARIQSIEMSSRGIKAAVIHLPAPGLPAPRSNWSISTSWEYFTLRGDSWNSACTGLVWRVLFDETLIREIKAIAEKHAATESAHDRIVELYTAIKRFYSKQGKTDRLL